jgi:cytochrome c-type biogenesis protein CcmH/NrfG
VKALIVVVLVVAVLVGGLLALRSSRGAGMPDQEVIDRAKQREREQAAKDDPE